MTRAEFGRFLAYLLEERDNLRNRRVGAVDVAPVARIKGIVVETDALFVVVGALDLPESLHVVVKLHVPFAVFDQLLLDEPTRQRVTGHALGEM